MQRRLSGTLSTVVGVVTLAATVWWLRSDRGEAAAEAGRPPFVLPVTLAVVEQGEVRPRANLTGTVRAPTRAFSAFETDGVLVELLVREVDSFAAGEVLARLTSREEELALAASRADLALAQAELDKLRAGTREEEKARIGAERDVYKAEQDLAAAEVARGEKLIAERHISEQELDRLKAQHQASIARTEAAGHSLAEALAGTRAEDIAISEAKLAVAQAAVDAAELDHAKTFLRASYGGVVLSRQASVGDYLSAGDPVLEVVDLGELEIVVEIPSRFAVRLGAHPTVRVSMDDLEGFELETILDAKIPAADERSRNFRGLIRLDADDPGRARLEPGMFVRVELLLEGRRGSIVPADAVRVLDGGTLVVRALRAGADAGDAGAGAVTAEFVPVRVLASDGERSVVEAEGGVAALAAGDEVVVTGVDMAFPGAQLLPRGEGGLGGPPSAGPRGAGAPPDGEGPSGPEVE